MYYNEKTQIYLNGEFLKANKNNTSLYNQTMHYGYGVFEGIRAYATDSGPRIYKCREHYERLKKSCELLYIPFDYEISQLESITYDLLERNNLTNAYIRPLVYGEPNMSLSVSSNSSLFICAWEWGALLGEKQLKVCTSSFCRPHPKSIHIEAKACGHYVNSILASHEAEENGYDEALLLDSDGFIAEGPGANLFFEKDEVLYTPQIGNILPGITRSTVLSLAENLDIKVKQGLYKLSDLKKADSAFFCGTAAEVIGIQSIDDTTFPNTWSETLGKRIQDAYYSEVRRSNLKIN